MDNPEQYRKFIENSKIRASLPKSDMDPDEAVKIVVDLATGGRMNLLLTEERRQALLAVLQMALR